MNKVELLSNVNEYLYANNKRKSVSIPRQVFTISTDGGQSHQFSVKPANREFRYTIADAEVFLDALIHVIEEALKDGEEVNVYGFGALSLKYRKPRYVYHPETGERIDVKGMYLPKFRYGTDLKRCASVYGSRQSDHETEEQVSSMPREEYLDEYFDDEDDEL